ncbi:MAG: PP2C family protein-serine/threonine phosphatase, partial [Planctomycetia bacterium]
CAGAPFVEQETTLAPGETLVLYTDGVTEAPAPDGRLFGLTGLTTFLSENADATADDLCRRLAAALDAHQASRQRDDVTLMVLRRTVDD